MFEPANGRGIRRLAAGLAILSLFALVVTAFVLWTVRREQEIVTQLIAHVPPADLAAAQELSGDLRLQGGLLLLLALNIIGTTVAFAMVIRGYLTSERQLQDVRVLSTDILASMDAGVITTDRNGRVTSINPSGMRLLGFDESAGVDAPDDKNPIGRSLGDIGAGHAMLESIRGEVAAYQTPIRDRDYAIDRGGHRMCLRAGCTLLANRRDEQLGTVLHVRDVTEKTLIEERLRRMERYMGLGSLAAGLQHEIKNPLSALSLHIQLLCERFADAATPGSDPDADADINESLDVLHTEVRRINNVLDGFRNYASSNDLGSGPVDVTMLIEKLVRLLRPQAESQHVQVHVDLPREWIGVIQGDSVRLEQVLLNLALNGLAAMPGGGTLTFALAAREDSVCVLVTDSGTGIPPEIRPKVFDPYFTTRRDGTGMGLALCDKIVRQHNGEIDFSSRPGQTTFTVTLPTKSP